MNKKVKDFIYWREISAVDVEDQSTPVLEPSDVEAVVSLAENEAKIDILEDTLKDIAKTENLVGAVTLVDAKLKKLKEYQTSKRK
jgi:hypothetical protein